ncbi:sulfatase [Pelagicoccus mobilis]|uniref:Sulfatase n=1 Tax=Pelagicoccus mobilis TaxID=415221 RepID=A0A934RRC1_9BACT|nr:sulfatase [Pelagicoccus mobilis]MBK1875477.1 sulfatase [Pelagicoccus mobilis]
MSIRRLINVSVFLATIGAVCLPQETHGRDQPNILFVFLDDFGWRDAGFMGSDFYETPVIDQLASEGTVFTNAYAASANCAPSRASLLSGQYTPRHEVYNVGTKPRGKAEHRRLEHIPGVDVLDTDIVTWAELAQEAGYVTAIMGKWHLSDDPLDYGFDVNIGGDHRGSPPKGYYSPHVDAPGLEDAPDGEYITDRLNDEALKFIEDNKKEPWLLYLSHFAVHTPLDAKKELLQKYEEKKPGELHSHVEMGTMIECLDQGIGRILGGLKELELDENTVVILTSDNGGYGPATDMYPLKGYKGTYFEGGIRVPLIVKWPGVGNPGEKVVAPVSGVDIYPTLCDIMEIDLPDEQVLDGESLRGLVGREAELKVRPLFWHFPAYLQSYRGVTDEQRDPLFRSRPCTVVRLGDWKLHYYYEDRELMLFNLKEDVGEERNLAESHPEKARELLKLIEDWVRETDAAVPVRPNPMFDGALHSKAIQAVRNSKK